MHKSDDYLPRSNWHVPDWLKAASSHGLLSRLPESLVEAVVRGASRVETPTGAVALRWDESPKAGFILRGTFRGFIASLDGGQVTTRYLKTGDMAGVFAPRLPRLARGIQALEPGELLLVDSERIKELALSNPAFAWEMIQELTTVLNSNQKALYVRAFGSVRQRVVSAIVERAAVADRLNPGGRVAGTQHELAIAIGSVREVVASELQQLKREGLLEIHRGGVVILQPDALVKEATTRLGISQLSDTDN
ncbi:MAG: Crp/Fnr family transcriptional regulator [Chloroflexi bacterium]|nr:MAG: Crp/Fnr family transcriptional regulator [Chloroflexota bacterium]